MFSCTNSEDLKLPFRKSWNNRNKFHSEILASLNSNTNKILSPGLKNNYTLKCCSGNFPTILTYMIVFENCQNNISVYGCSPILGTKFYSCWNLMKPGSQSGTYVVKSEYFKNRISMYGCSPIQGNIFQFLLTFHEARILECNIFSVAGSLAASPWMPPACLLHKVREIELPALCQQWQKGTTNLLKSSFHKWKQIVKGTFFMCKAALFSWYHYIYF